MKNLFIITFLFPLLFTGCDSGETSGKTEGTTIRLSNQSFRHTRVVDADNLEIEQTVLNISVLLTDPGSDAITNRYVDAGFSTVDDYRLVTLPDEPSALQTKDIYVVANYTDTDLTTLTTITELHSLSTPAVNKTDNLDPTRGFSMYGMTAGFDFTSGETAEVYVSRACAKIRVTMTFPDDPGISTDNEFLIGYAAGYTYLTDYNPPRVLPRESYFNFAENMPLADNGNDSYTGIAYIYESASHPILYLYTHMEGSAQEYSAELPLPERNHLYECDVRIYTEEQTRTLRKMDRSSIIETRITVHGPDGTFADYGTSRQRIR